MLLTNATFVVAIFGVVAGILGMNFELLMFENPVAFKWVLLLTGIAVVVIFFTSVFVSIEDLCPSRFSQLIYLLVYGKLN